MFGESVVKHLVFGRPLKELSRQYRRGFLSADLLLGSMLLTPYSSGQFVPGFGGESALLEGQQPPYQ